MARTLALALTVALLAALPPAAVARQTVKLTAGFSPDRLSTPTTISFGFKISAVGRRVPAALTGIDLRYPVNIGLATSGLGVATCILADLETSGPSGCPANSRMGFGTALADIQVGRTILEEPASITLLAGPAKEGHLNFLVYADGEAPVSAQIVFSARLLPEPPPFGGRLHFDIPLAEGLPEGPDVSIVKLRTTLGPRGLTYYERIHGRTLAYKPSGVLLPSRCPHGGFPFAASVTFQDNTRAVARTAVPCPHR
ncbi:MAG: hypothetical protein H0X28_05715 [Solirubrobacterales bacterium]|nr:hypothetical protein [Solirubrobacterales bacterium]